MDLYVNVRISARSLPLMIEIILTDFRLKLLNYLSKPPIL